MSGPDPAATILTLRPRSAGFEVLMVQRKSRGFFGDLVVFPGGRVEGIDIHSALTRDDDLFHRYAAVRELAEETGIVLTTDGAVPGPDLKDIAFYRWLESQSTQAAVESLVLVSRWVTPEEAPRRFDTRFYVVGCPDPPQVRIDEDELIGHHWVRPDDALGRHERGDWAMMRPTIAHLRWLRRWSSVEEALESARGADDRTLIEPRRVDDGSLIPIQMPAEH